MRRVLALLSAAFLVLALAAPASAGVSTKWDRLNPGTDPANPAEHERLTCVGGDSWSCRYDKLPEPKLGYHWDRTTGVFRGTITTDPQACPVGLVDHNGRDLCTDSHVTKVIAGRTTYVAPDRSVFTWDENLILTDAANGWAPLYMYLVPFGLACPWYGSFGDALEANPSGAFDCIAATVTGAWRARIGSAGVHGTATIQAYTTGSGSLALKLARLKAATYLPVTLSKGTCASVGSPLITFPAIRTTSSGTAARTSTLTVAQVAKIKAATKGTGRMAIRVGSRTTGGVKCGVFTLLYAPIGIVLPSALKGSGLEQFQDALKAAGYSAQILFSQDAATEKMDVEALISRGIKVLILCPQDGTAASAAADEARAAGVKVISYARLILGTASVDYYLNFDTGAVGAAQAQYLIDKAGATKGNNLYLYAGAASDNNTFQFLEGAWETLQPRIADGTFVIRNSGAAAGLQANRSLTHAQEAAIIGQVTTNWDPTTARTVAASNLAALQAAEKGTVFILAPNDTTARAIADAFAADKDVTTSYVTGQDAEKAWVQYIIDGKQGMTVFKDPRTLVKDAIAAAVAFLKGGAPVKTTTQNNDTIDVPSRLLPVVAVTRDNIQAALIDSGYYLASDFTGSWPGKP